MGYEIRSYAELAGIVAVLALLLRCLVSFFAAVRLGDGGKGRGRK